jgi:hypothetical protein
MKVSVFSQYLCQFVQFRTEVFFKRFSVQFSTKPYIKECHRGKIKNFIVVILRTCNINNFQSTSIQIDFHFFLVIKHCAKDSKYYQWYNHVRSIGWHIRKNSLTKNIDRESGFGITGLNLAYLGFLLGPNQQFTQKYYFWLSYMSFSRTWKTIVKSAFFFWKFGKK